MRQDHIVVTGIIEHGEIDFLQMGGIESGKSMHSPSAVSYSQASRRLRLTNRSIEPVN